MAIAIIAAEFHREIAQDMIAAAQEELGASAGTVVRVAGCYEIPLMADRQLSLADVEAVLALGFIEKGETKHGEVMGHVVHKTLLDLQLKHGKPVGMGIIGPGATLEQAQARKETQARGAARAAMQSLALLRRR